MLAVAAAEIESDFPIGVPHPKWLRSAYHDEYWLITGASPRSDCKIVFNLLMSDGSLLTDAQHASLLDTVRRMSIGLRTGSSATVTSAFVQMSMTNAIVNWVLWMDLNGIHAFSQLTRADLEAYTEKAIYGTSHLLDLPLRTRNYVSCLRASGATLPRKGKLVDLARLFQEARIPGARARHDRASLYEVFKAAQEDGLYLNPAQLKTHEAGPSALYRMSQIQLLRLLQPWEYQWQLRHTLPGDKLTFDPFPSESISKIVQKLAEKSGRTETVPIRQAMFLIDRCIRWVIDYSPSMLEVIERTDVTAQEHPKELGARTRAKALDHILTDLELPPGPGQPWPVNPRVAGNLRKDGLGVGSLIRRLFASCFVVIAAFTARRHHEVTSCREKGPYNEYCITSDEEGDWIELWIEKTVQGWDKTPCPEVVVKAVDVLRKLSKSARTINGRVDLFQYKLLGLNRAVLFRVPKGLRELTSCLDIPPLSDGTEWTFEARQLRRFFAIIYMWRYEFGELSALSYQLRHYNPDMTRRYITEPTQGKIFREVQTEHAVSILKEVGLGRREGSGPFGERFKRTAEKIRAQIMSSVQVFSEEKFAERIERLIVRSGKVLKGSPWGYCACQSSTRDLVQARCLEGQDLGRAAGPDQANATLLTCATCPHHFTNAAFAPYTASQIELHEKAAADEKNGHLIRNASAACLPRLREYYDRSFCQSKPVRSSHAKQDQAPSPRNRPAKPRRRSQKDQRKD